MQKEWISLPQRFNGIAIILLISLLQYLLFHEGINNNGV